MENEISNRNGARNDFHEIAGTILFVIPKK